MKKKFKAQLLSGHKDHAVEVPFDPAIEWRLEPQSLWRGRRGFPVRGKIAGAGFGERNSTATEEGLSPD